MKIQDRFVLFAFFSVVLSFSFPCDADPDATTPVIISPEDVRDLNQRLLGWAALGPHGEMMFRQFANHPGDSYVGFYSTSSGKLEVREQTEWPSKIIGTVDSDGKIAFEQRAKLLLNDIPKSYAVFPSGIPKSRDAFPATGVSVFPPLKNMPSQISRPADAIAWCFTTARRTLLMCAKGEGIPGCPWVVRSGEVVEIVSHDRKSVLARIMPTLEIEWSDDFIATMGGRRARDFWSFVDENGRPTYFDLWTDIFPGMNNGGELLGTVVNDHLMVSNETTLLDMHNQLRVSKGKS